LEEFFFKNLSLFRRAIPLEPVDALDGSGLDHFVNPNDQTRFLKSKLVSNAHAIEND
jgi:hypothetical protein